MRRRHEHVLAAGHGLQLLGRTRTGLLSEEALDFGMQHVALLRIFHVGDPLAEQSGKGWRSHHSWTFVFGLLEQLVDVSDEALAALKRGQGHAEAVLRSVLEEGPGPSRTLTETVRLEGAETIRAAPDRCATAAVGDDHAIAEHLREKLHVGRFAAAGASTAEFHQGILELRPLDAVLVHELVLDGDDIQAVLPMLVEEVLRHFLRLHLESIVWAHLDADRTTCAIVWGDLNRVVQTAELTTLRFPGQETLRCLCLLLLVQKEGSDHGVRAHDRAEVALGASVWDPHRNFLGQGSLLEPGLTNRSIAASHEGTHRQAVGAARIDGLEENT
mmetsp:Transcript_158875/g.509444  ORF Transcript_158875/g.509444 Transcript_158875/m.509444 type:complete len:330 (-) Transcript_158875:476-1465(-)